MQIGKPLPSIWHLDPQNKQASAVPLLQGRNRFRNGFAGRKKTAEPVCRCRWENLCHQFAVWIRKTNRIQQYPSFKEGTGSETGLQVQVGRKQQSQFAGADRKTFAVNLPSGSAKQTGFSSTPPCRRGGSELRSETGRSSFEASLYTPEQ